MNTKTTLAFADETSIVCNTCMSNLIILQISILNESASFYEDTLQQSGYRQKLSTTQKKEKYHYKINHKSNMIWLNHNSSSYSKFIIVETKNDTTVKDIITF